MGVDLERRRSPRSMWRLGPCHTPSGHTGGGPGQGGGASSQACESVGRGPPGGVQPQASLLPVTPDDMWACAPWQGENSAPLGPRGHPQSWT